MGSLRGGEQPLPSKRSQTGGLVFQVGLAVVAGVLAAPSRGIWPAVAFALIVLALSLVVWRQIGKWFTLVVGAESIGFLLLRALAEGGMDDNVATLVAALLVMPLWVVATTATWMQQLRAVVVTPVDPHEVEPGPQLVEELKAAGYRTEADMAYGLYGKATVVAVFAHRSDPVYAEISVSGGGAAQASGVVTLLQGGGALNTETGAHFPRSAKTLRQVFPRADLATLTRRHLDALAWLAGRGVAPAPVTPGAYAISVEAMLDGTAAALRAHPLWHAARTALLRILRRHLDQRPLHRQRDVADRAKAVLAGV